MEWVLLLTSFLCTLSGNALHASFRYRHTGHIVGKSLIGFGIVLLGILLAISDFGFWASAGVSISTGISMANAVGVVDTIIFAVLIGGIIVFCSTLEEVGERLTA